MKIKNLLSSICAVSCVALSFVGCQDYDNGFTDKVIAYERDFRDAFGEVSPEQDWNIATRATVNVTTSQPSNVKIYAYDGLHYSIVGDYSNVVGSRTLGFDVAKGIKKILVTDGRTGQKTTIGGSVSFDGRGTRNIHDKEDIVETSGKYIEFPKEGAEAYIKVLPELNDNSLSYEKTNLPKVIKNFKFISNGDFTIHPVFWDTSQKDVLGVYYTDDEGVYHEVDVYTIKGEGNDAALQNLTWYDFVISGDVNAEINTDAPDDEDEAQRINKAAEIVEKNLQDYDNIDNIEYDKVNDRYYLYKGDDKYIVKGFEKAVYKDEYTVQGSYFKTYKISTAPGENKSTAGYSWNPPIDTQRSKEITIKIPENTEFGFYIKTSNGNYQYYTDASKNGTYGSRFTEEYKNKNACYASYIDINDEKYFCFEDWDLGDFDLNDLVFKITGDAPELIDNDADPSATWDILCEDLGSSFDTDFNDVVLKVEHVSGRRSALVTPLAAGGTLASYTFFRTKTMGEDGTEKIEYTNGREIHQRFEGVGQSKSGDFAPIDVIGGDDDFRDNEGRQISIDVPENWSLAYYRADKYGQAGEGDYWDDGDYMNMGGFIVKVLPAGMDAEYHLDFNDARFGEASIVAAPDKGDIPQMICVPDQYFVVTSEPDENGKMKYYRTTYKFAWSQELVSLADSYNETEHKFSDWVTSYSESGNTYSACTDWYKYPTGDIVKRVQVGSPVECDEDGNVEGGDPDDPDNPDIPTGPDYSIYGTPMNLAEYTEEVTWGGIVTIKNAILTEQLTGDEITITFIIEGATWGTATLKGAKISSNDNGDTWMDSESIGTSVSLPNKPEENSTCSIAQFTISKSLYSGYKYLSCDTNTNGSLYAKVYITITSK